MMECVKKLLYEIKRRGRNARPASVEQMEQLKEITGGRRLPQAYIEFMSAMGNQTDNCFMVG